MSARSAQRTRWRRWRMGRAIAGRTDRNGRMSGSEAQVVGGDDALVPVLLLLQMMKLISLFTHQYLSRAMLPGKMAE